MFSENQKIENQIAGTPSFAISTTEAIRKALYCPARPTECYQERS
jgi:hypothetical protein